MRPTTRAPRPGREVLEDAAATFRVLAWADRLELLWLLADRERDAGSLAAELDRSVATVSQQLGTLSWSGLVRPRQAGRHRIYALDIYALDGPHPLEPLRIIVDHRGEAGQRARERRDG